MMEMLIPLLKRHSLAIAEINADSEILNGTALEGISNTTAPLDVKRSVDSGELLKYMHLNHL
jgi:hypothetical protein